MQLCMLVAAFIVQIVEAQYGEVGPPSPSPPPDYHNSYPPCEHGAVHPKSTARITLSPSAEKSAQILVQQPIPEAVSLEPQKYQTTSASVSSTPAPMTTKTTYSSVSTTKTATKASPTDLSTSFSQNPIASLATSSATHQAKTSLTTRMIETQRSLTSKSKNEPSTRFTQQPPLTLPPIKEKEEHKVKSVKPAELPQHTPINPPSQPEGVLAKGISPIQIPPVAIENEVPAKKTEDPEEKFAFTDCISDTLFVVDSTSSVRQYFERHREYVLNTVNLLEAVGDDGTRIGVIVYSSKLRKQIRIPFGKHKNRTEIEIAIKELPYFSGITATGAALNLSLEALRTRRPNVPTNVVVITDGFSYDIVDGPAEELHRLPNVRTFTVTVTDAWREYELQTIAGNPHRVFKGMGSVRDLVTALTSCSNGPRKGHILPDDSTVDSSLPGQPATATAATIETYAPSVTSAALKQTATGKPSKEADTIKSTPPNIKQETPTSLTSGSSSSSSEEQAKSFTQTSTPSPYSSLNRVLVTSSRTKLNSFIPISSSRPYTLKSTGTTRYSTTFKPRPVDKKWTLTTSAPTTTAPTSTTASTTASTSKAPEKAVSLTPFKASGKSCLFDLMIVLDASGSLQSRFQRQLELTIRLVDRLIIGPEDARVAVIKYAGPRKAKVVFPFSKYTDKESLEAALRKVGFIGGTTYTNEALQKADAELSGPDGRRSHASPIVIVFTDGFSHDDPEPGATALRNKGIAVYAVGINDIYPVNRNELLAIAGEESRVFLDKNIAQFEHELAELTKGCIRRR